MKRIILIDASGLLFRAYFAMMKNPLRTSQGNPTSAVFGFLRMIFHLIKKYPSHNIAAAFDVPRATLERTKNYEAYKANRSDSPPDLIEQIPIAKECLEKAGIPAITIAGHEADDVLASLTKKYAEDHEILIFTGDKDLLQLVNNNVSIALPDKNSPNGAKILNRDGVKELKGVYPEEILDYLAILGDTSDNIPGVKGIGEKGALSLIEEYHSLENIYHNLEHIKPALAKKLQENRENAFLSQSLVTLQQNLAVSLPNFHDNPITINNIATPELIQKLQELELFSLIKEISQSISAEHTLQETELFPQSNITVEELTIETIAKFSSAPVIGLQIIDNIIEFSAQEKIYHISKENLSCIQTELQTLFSSLKEGQLIVFDLKKLIHIFSSCHITLPLCDDLKLMAYLLDPSRSHYSVAYLNILHLSKNDESSCYFYDLKNIMSAQLEKYNLIDIYSKIELPLRPLLANLEKSGVKINIELMKEISDELDTQLRTLSQKIYLLAGKEFNILSPKQLGIILFEEIGLKPQKKTKTKNYSTDEETLEALSYIHPLPKEILQYRSLSKFKNTYTDALPKLADSKHRIHTTLNQTVTATGRLSSGDPNLQNIPIRTDLGREIRTAFIPEQGKVFISADYSQIELRLFACLSKDPTMQEFFLSGGDVHKHTAAAMFKIPESEISDDMRRAAKTVNYGISYGMSAFRLSNELNIDIKEAREFIHTYFETFPGIQHFMRDTLEFACTNGYVQTLFHRRRPTPELWGKTPDKLSNLSHPSRFAINAVIQGTAADIIKMAMLDVQQLINEKFPNTVTMILQIHDELLFEVDPSITESFSYELRKIMTNIISLEVPLEVEIGIGNNWNDAH